MSLEEEIHSNSLVSSYKEKTQRTMFLVGSALSSWEEGSNIQPVSHSLDIFVLDPILQKYEQKIFYLRFLV